MDDREDLVEEPTADSQTAKPIRRAHCKSAAELDARAAEGCETGSEASGRLQSSKESSELDAVLDMFERRSTELSASDSDGEEAMTPPGEQGNQPYNSKGLGATLAALEVKDVPSRAQMGSGVGRCRAKDKQANTRPSKAAQDRPEGAEFVKDAQVLREGQGRGKLQRPGKSGANGTGEQESKQQKQCDGKLNKGSKRKKGAAKQSKCGVDSGLDAASAMHARDVSEGGLRWQKRQRAAENGRQPKGKIAKKVRHADK